MLSWADFVLFDLIFYIQANNFSVMLGRVFLGWTSTKQQELILLKDTMQCGRWDLNPQLSWEAWFFYNLRARPPNNMGH